MKKFNRRKFIKTGALTAAGFVAASKGITAAPQIFTSSRTIAKTAGGKLTFVPQYVQKGRGPHIYPLTWATDKNRDTFYSDISIEDKNIQISDTKGKEKFGVNVRWNVEGFGFTNLTADNGGELYSLPPEGKDLSLNLNLEFARSRVARNRERRKKFENVGLALSREAMLHLDLSEEFLEEAIKKPLHSEECGELSQKSLYYSLWGAEKLELEKARADIVKRGTRDDFDFGCDARGFYQMYQDKFLPLFTDLFTYANITFVIKGDGIINDFEPVEGYHQFPIRDVLVDKLREYGIKTQGRLLFWFHDCCTPDWLKRKSYDELLKYAEKHTREVVKHYGDRMYAWEMVNELHDWANELHLDHEQTIELTRLITDVTKAYAPNVKRTINNCCPFAEYVQMKSYSGSPAVHPQRTPYQFSKDIIEAGVDIDILEQQMYYPYRDIQDSILLIEKLSELGKPMQISEIGVSGGPTNKSVKLGTVGFPEEPPLWHRYWDEETQADWMEDIYTLIYSKPYIYAGNWFDFVDPFSYMRNGGLLRSPEGEKKEAYHRMQKMQNRFKNLT